MSIALKSNQFFNDSIHLRQQKVCVMGTGEYLPGPAISTISLLKSCSIQERYGISEHFLERALGVSYVHRAKHELLPSDMAIPAAEMALNECPELNRQEIDMVIFCGMDRDASEPSTAHRLNDKLGLAAAETMDISDACLGFVRGLIMASRAIALGHVRFALVATGELSSKIVDSQIDEMRRGLPKESVKTRLGIFSVCDAGSAVILGPTPFGSSAGFGSFHSATNSKDRDKCYYRRKEDGTIEAEMKMDELFKSGATLMEESLKLHPAPKDTTYVISHQVSARYHRVIEQLGIVPKERVIKSFDEYGNVTTNSFAINFRKVMNNPNTKIGDRIFCIFGGSGTTYCQFDYQL